MTSIAHLSDIHFGAHDPQIVAAIEAWLIERQPELVIISGDLTQRARTRQFRQAAAFIKRLRAGGVAVLAVPGNHDVPLYDVTRRLLSPLGRYKRLISHDPCPWFETDALAVLGINTARSIAIKGGRIGHRQMRIIEQRFRDVPPHKSRILVTHHPLFSMPLGENGKLSAAVGRNTRAITFVKRAEVHLALAGHFHLPFAGSADEMVENFGSLLVVQAGTATSVRLRGGEVQSFNWMQLNGPHDLTLQLMRWQGETYQCSTTARYVFTDGTWRPAPENNPA